MYIFPTFKSNYDIHVYKYQIYRTPKADRTLKSNDCTNV